MLGRSTTQKKQKPAKVDLVLYEDLGNDHKLCHFKEQQQVTIKTTLINSLPNC